MTMLVIDANVAVSALAGRSMPLLAALNDCGFALVMPAHQAYETEAVLTRKLELPPEFVAVALSNLWRVVHKADPAEYEAAEDGARERLASGGQPDWPVLALAIASDSAILSNDRDFFGTGVPVWSTTNVRHATPETMSDA